MRDLHYLTLAELSAALAERRISSMEATQAALDRIHALDGRLHAFVRVTADEALAAARRADDERARGQLRGPLHGVPLALKDLVDMAGVPTTSGTRVRAHVLPDTDATVTTRLVQAGAVILGKLKLTEGAYAEHHPDVTAPVNPWNAEHWTGVSSSGSGVAVAAGLCWGALGTDTGGSIRFPSGACGVTGLKPTWGRVSRAGVFALAESLDHVGPMARSARDAALMLKALAGPDRRDPTALRAPVPDYAAALDGDVRGLVVGLDPGYALDGVDGEVAAAVRHVVETLADLGAEIREVRLPDASTLIAQWGLACAVETAIAHEAHFPRQADDYGPALRGLIEAGRGLPATALGHINLARAAFSGALAGLFQSVDVLVAPTLPVATPSLAGMAELLGAMAESTSPLRFTAPFNMSGSPSLTVPAGVTALGLPIGVQLVGRHLDEGLLLRAGDAFQRVTGWHARHPEV
jgi:amidase